MASGEIKISEFQDLNSSQLDETTKINVTSGSVISNKNIPITEFIADNLTTDNRYITISSKQAKILNDTKISKVAPISPASKTKISYNVDGIVISGSDATTSDIIESTNKRYVTDSQLTVIANTSGVNSGDNKLGTKTIDESDIADGKAIVYNYDSDKLIYAPVQQVVTDHTLLTNIGIKSHAQIDSHILSTSNPHSVTKEQIGLLSVPNLDTTNAVNNAHTHSNKSVIDGLSDNSGIPEYNDSTIWCSNNSNGYMYDWYALNFIGGSVNVNGEVRGDTLKAATTTGSPMSISSSTLVSNLNADLLDGNHASAFATSGHNHDGVYAPVLGADDNYVTDAEKAALHTHSNKTALDAVSGTNTGDQFTATTASMLIGRGGSSGDGAAQEITLGTGLTMSGTTLNASVSTSNFVIKNPSTSSQTITYEGSSVGLEVDAINGVAIYGKNTSSATIGTTGVKGEAVIGYGVHGKATGSDGTGVRAETTHEFGTALEATATTNGGTGAYIHSTTGYALSVAKSSSSTSPIAAFSGPSGSNTYIYDGYITSQNYRVNSMNAAPSSASASGVAGDIRFTSDYIYVCVAANTWKRTQLTTW